MRLKFLLITLILSFALSGCAGASHIIGYDISKAQMLTPSLGKIKIIPFDDSRPIEEQQGVRGKFLTFSSRDAHFDRPVPEAVQEILAEELNNAGFEVTDRDQGYDYQIYGAVEHFQAIMAPAKITFLPYLGSVSTIWAKDDFTIALSIYIKMTGKRKKILIDKTFDVSKDMKLSAGLLQLARISRGFNYKLKLLDEALKNVLQQVRDQVVAQAKNR